MNLVTRHACWLSCLAAVTGCHSAEAPAPAPVATHDSPAPTPAIAAPAKESRTAARTANLGKPKVTPAQAVEFKPPFPERTDLFEAPKRAQNTVRRDDEQGQSVELKGFVNVDGPSAVLSIDGVLAPVPEGGEKYGVHVISVQPPKAVLHRGRSRWTATL
jgi:hypothetical protein